MKHQSSQMNNQSNQLAPPSTTQMQHTPKPLGKRLKPYVILAGAGVSIAYGYKKAGYVGSGIAVILYYGLLVNLAKRD